MQLNPLSDNIIVKVDEVEEEEIVSGIIVVRQQKERSNMATVIAVGNGVLLPDGTRSKLSVAEGDRIMFAKYAGTDLSIDGESFTVLSEKDIYGVISE